MTVSKLLPLALLLSVLCLPARATQTGRTTERSRPTEDRLARHLSAAQTFQLSGDLERAGTENRAIVAIALARLGAIAIRERQLQLSVELLRESIAARDDADARTNLAIAHMRLMEVERAMTEVRAALALDEKNARAHHVLGKLLYMKADYTGARRELERAVLLEPDLDAGYTLGMTYLRLKDTARAKLLFEEMQSALKNSAHAHLLFGRAYEEAGFAEEAEREFRVALVVDPRAPRAHFYLGYVILRNFGSERIAQAGEEFDRELQVNPHDFYSNFFRGVVAAAEGNHRKAVEHLSQATRVKPDSGDAHLFLGQSQAELDDPAAEKNLRRAIELTPDVSQNSFQIKRAHYLLGRVLLKSGRREEAEKELTVARGLQAQSLESSRQGLREMLDHTVKSTNEMTVPSQMMAAAPNRPEDNKPTSDGSAEDVLLIEESTLDMEQGAKQQKVKDRLTEILAQAFHNLGVIAAQRGELSVSLQEFATAAKWKTDLAGLDRNWGIVSFRAGQYETAIPLLLRQLKADPDDALTRRMLGVSYYLTNSFPKVVETLKPLEPRITADAELAYIYGVSLVQIAEPKLAQKLFEGLSIQNQKKAVARFYAGQGFSMLEAYERAFKEFGAAAELDPKMPQVHYNAGQSLIRLNRLQDAEREFRAELLLNPEDVSAKYHLAYVLLEQKQQTATALGLLREIVSVRPQYAEAHYQLGKTLIDLGEVNKAIEHLEIAARAEPSKDYIHYQLSIAYRRASRSSDADRELQLYRELKSSSRSRELPVNMGLKQNVP